MVTFSVKRSLIQSEPYWSGFNFQLKSWLKEITQNTSKQLSSYPEYIPPPHFLFGKKFPELWTSLFLFILVYPMAWLLAHSPLTFKRLERKGSFILNLGVWPYNQNQILCAPASFIPVYNFNYGQLEYLCPCFENWTST